MHRATVRVMTRTSGDTRVHIDNNCASSGLSKSARLSKVRNYLVNAPKTRESAFIRETRVACPRCQRVSHHNQARDRVEVRRETRRETTTRDATSTQVRSISLKSMMKEMRSGTEETIVFFVLTCLVLLWIYVGCAARRRAWVRKSKKLNNHKKG